MNRYDWTAPFWIGAVGFVTFVIASWIIGAQRFDADLTMLNTLPPDAAAHVREAQARLTWSLSLAMLFSAVVLLILASADALRSLPRPAIIRGLVVLCAVGVIVFWLGMREASDLGGPVGGALTSSVWRRAGNPLVGKYIISLTNVIALESVLAFGMVASLTLKHSSNSDVDRHLDALILGRRHLDRLLYAGAAVLTAGVFQIAALYSWSLAPFSPQSISIYSALRGFSQSIIGIAGVGFSTLLLGMYAIAADRLRRAATEAAQTKYPDTTPDERIVELYKRDWPVMRGRDLRRIAAAFAPALSAVVSALVKL
jgi:hypothetical protein